MNLQITYKKSEIGSPKKIRETLRTLGLKKLHQTVIRKKTPIVMGLINKVNHLVDYKEVAE